MVSSLGGARGGLLYATSRRLRWPDLLRRTFDVDVLECAKCHGRIRGIETVVGRNTTRRILERLGIRLQLAYVAFCPLPSACGLDQPRAFRLPLRLGYASPVRLKAQAARRLNEIARFVQAVSRPAGMRPFAEGL
jgi:hypothetical protein